MKLMLRIIRMLIVIIAISGCAKSEPGLRILGEDVSMALKTKNIEAYLNLCVTIKDKKYLINSSELTFDEKRAQTALLSTTKRDLGRAREDRSANFNDISWVKGWDRAIVQKVVLGKRMNLSGGIMCYENIIVKFRKKTLPDLKIGKVVKVQGIWKIMDDHALSFMSRI
ncbi:MAG: hypothetical protein V1747_07040 [Candidatus Omnitrophota bacterium]